MERDIGRVQMTVENTRKLANDTEIGLKNEVAGIQREAGTNTKGIIEMQKNYKAKLSGLENKLCDLTLMSIEKVKK